MEKNKILKDVHCYSNQLSEPKVIGNRVLRVEIFFIVITSVQVRELIQTQMNSYNKRVLGQLRREPEINIQVAWDFQQGQLQIEQIWDGMKRLVNRLKEYKIEKLN